MFFKQQRMGPTLLDKARTEGFFDQIHVIFGGTGAIGGSTAIQLIGILEECLQWIGATSSPRIVVTGRTHQEVRQFTSRLFELQEIDHGRRPERLSGIGFRTVGGVIVEMATMTVDPSISGLVGFSALSEDDRRASLIRFLSFGGLDLDSPPRSKATLLAEAVETGVGHPFTQFLVDYRNRTGLPGEGRRFRSAIIGIPLPSIAAYKLSDLEAAGRHLGVQPNSSEMEHLKSRYLHEMRDDLGRIAKDLADEVLAAHTTGVGGMYDEYADGSRKIRLGFAHLGIDDRLLQKQAFADHLTCLYSEQGIKMLITAAAVGIDSISVKKRPPLQSSIRQQLAEAANNGFQVIPESDLRSGAANVFAPIDLDLCEETHDPVTFDHRGRLEVAYALKSGENGYFTVANADALYRVMRVASDSELGMVMARTAILGDDPLAPRFKDNICYYTETDYSRQIFDFLGQPQLRNDQLTGLQPKALQDLGSAKHQGELHTLGLLILLHRLRTLNLDAIPLGLDLKAFDPQAFFEQHSQVLTLDHIKGLDPRVLSDDLKMLVTAATDSDLAPLKHFYQAMPKRQEAAHRILQAVLRAVWAVPSLGSPIIYSDKRGRSRVLTGYYAAPIDRVITHRDIFAECFRKRFETIGGGDDAAFKRLLEFYIASFGFIDIRPHAVLVTARSPDEDLSKKVQVFYEESPLVEALERIEPYSYFTTSGLLALLLRLKRLWRLAQEFRIELGTSNTFRAHLARDADGRPLLVPGVVEAFRMVAEGLEKNTGIERLDGPWGYLPV